MPLPLGHIAIGLAVHDVSARPSAFGRWRVFAAIVVLSNLPDIDVLLGLALHWNGSEFHRGPTHSLLFAFAAGLLAARACGAVRWLPRLSFPACFALVLSHVAADALLSPAAVSFLWPLETHWSGGHTGWGEVAGMVLKGDRQDIWIALGSAAAIAAVRALRALAGVRPAGTTGRG